MVSSSSSTTIPYHVGKMSADSSPTKKSQSDPSWALLERTILHIPESNLITICGGLAGAASAIVSCPLDVIKTKLQAQGGFRVKGAEPGATTIQAYRGVRGTARIIWTEEGLRGLYRGLGPLLLGYIPTWAVYLTVYNKTQSYFNSKTGERYSRDSKRCTNSKQDHKFLANFNASLAAGTCSTFVTNPIWVIKTRLMSQSSSRSKFYRRSTPWEYQGTIDAAIKMYKTEGFRSFYSGLVPALIGLSHVAVQFPLYELLKIKFTGFDSGRAVYDHEKKRHFVGLSLAVFLSKVVASTATYPHEVVRTRLQTQQRWGSSSDGMALPSRYRGTLATCRSILIEEGWRGFYAGLGTNLVRAVPSAMTTILTFEYLKSAALKMKADALERTEKG